MVSDLARVHDWDYLDGLKNKCMALKHANTSSSTSANSNATNNGGAGENGTPNGTPNGNADGAGAKAGAKAGAGAGAGAGGGVASAGADFFSGMTTCMLTQGAPPNRIDTDTHLR